MRRLALLLLVASALWGAGVGSARSETEVVMELILAIDASGSVDEFEFATQVEGVAAAFRDSDFLETLAAIGDRGIAVTVLIWSDAERQHVAVPWTHVTDAETAEVLAGKLQGTRRRFAGNTALGSMLAVAIPMFDDNGFDGARRVIDVSGDGATNDGPPAIGYRDTAMDRGITINGLAIGASQPEVFEYYRTQVIGGPGSFLVEARAFFEFPAAIKRKLIRELRGPALSDAGSGRSHARR